MRRRSFRATKCRCSTARASTPIAALSDALAAAADAFIAEEGGALAERFAVAAPRVHRGLVVSGDRFIASHDALFALRDALPDGVAVEMEGAAIAQVCYEHQRAVRGRADHFRRGRRRRGRFSFTEFLTSIAATYSSGILSRFLRGSRLIRDQNPSGQRFQAARTSPEFLLVVENDSQYNDSHSVRQGGNRQEARRHDQRFHRQPHDRRNAPGVRERRAG